MSPLLLPDRLSISLLLLGSLALMSACDRGDPQSDGDTPPAQEFVQTEHGRFPHHEIPYIAQERVDQLTIDGRLDEALWDELPAIELQPMGANEAPFKTTVFAAYTDTALILGAHLEDDHIWSTLTERDQNLWTEEVLEIFLAPHGPDNPYIEVQINPLGTLFDAYFEAHRSDLEIARSWDLEGLTAAVHVEGTVNDPESEDEFWSVEMILPFEGMPFTNGQGEHLRPAPGERWRVNLYRFDRPDEDSTRAYGWSTKPRGDFHQVERFGVWTFGEPQHRDPL